MRNFLILIVYSLLLTACLDTQSQETLAPESPEAPPISNSAPVINSLPDQNVFSGQLLTFQITATDSDGDVLIYGLQNPPMGSSFNSNTGFFSWTPNLSQVGSYSLNFNVSDSSGSEVSITVSISVLEVVENPITLSSSSFMEGSYSDSLVSLIFKLPKPITSVRATHWNSFFTALDSASDISLDLDQINNDLIIPTQLSGDFSITLKGSVGKAQSGTIDFAVNYLDGSLENFSIPISITSRGYPTFKYNIINTKDTSVSVSRDKIISQIKMLNSVVSPFMTGILSSYEEKGISCGIDFIYQNNDSNQHRACVLSQVSPNSETVIFFKTISTSSGYVGGISLGTRKGALVSNSSFSHALIHELGHNFGLTHTHETYSAGNLHHSGANNGIYEANAFRRLVYSPNESLFSLEYGDGITDTPVDPFGSKFIETLNGGGGIHSRFNVHYEGESHFLFFDSQPIGDMFAPSDFACYQEYIDGNYYLNCPDLDFSFFDDSIINNIMSYWYKNPGDEHITPGQAAKILNVLDLYPDIK